MRWIAALFLLACPSVAVATPCTGPCRLLKTTPPCDVSVTSAFARDSIFPPTGNSDRYTAPTDEERFALERSIHAAAVGDSEAWGYALEAGYILCARRQEATLLWRPALTGSGWAIVAVRAKNARPAIIEAPHPIYDSGTLEQARYAYFRLKARALVASGTHRCANAAPTLCGGMTRVCGGELETYRESDVAHSERSMFHSAHRALSDAYPDAHVFSLHGMSDDGISLSDGTNIPTSSTSFVANLLFSFEDTFESELVTGCNQTFGAAVSDHLCGTTNVQGRYTNGLRDSACIATATRSTGRFIHLEQSLAMRRRFRQVIRAIERVLPKVR